MSTYLGYDVLDQTTPNMREAIAESFDRLGEYIGAKTGRREFDDTAGQPAPQRSFSWFATGRTEIDAMRAFIAARQGRLIPFWTPTYCAELVLAADALSAASSIVIATTGYGRYMFALTARKYIAITKPGGAFLIRKVAAVIDNGNGTETLTLTSGLGEDVGRSTLVSFLALCRLDSDDPEIQWDGTDHAEANLVYREVPKEVPA